MAMQAIQYAARGEAGLARLPAPELAPGQALLRVRAAGLCHTDIDVLHGRYGPGSFPLVPGHEYAGVVEAVAPDVAGLKIGDRVAVDPNLPCGVCPSCRKGLANLCRDLKAYGVTANGGFAEFSAVKAGHLHPIGDLPFDVAALAEPLACVLNGISCADIDVENGRTQSALVFGAGPIGLLLALALKARGVEEVTVADVSDSRLAFSAELGLGVVRSSAEDLAPLRRSFDFVADATGIPAVVERMIDYTADGGTVLIFGVCAPDSRISLAPFEIFRRQIRVAGSHSLNRNIPEALAMLQVDRSGMSRLVSHRLPLAEIVPFMTGKPATPTMKIQFVAED